MTKVKFLKDQTSQEGLRYEKGKTAELYDDAYAHELIRRKIAEEVREGAAKESKPEPAAEPEPVKRNKAPEPEPEPERPMFKKGR